MNLSKRQKIKHGNGLMDTKIASNRYLKQINLLSCESDTLRSFEYILRPSMYTDTIPVHIGCWILASSKLHILKVYQLIYQLKLKKLIHFIKTLRSMMNHLSTQHFQLIYSDTGIFRGSNTLKDY